MTDGDLEAKMNGQIEDLCCVKNYLGGKQSLTKEEITTIFCKLNNIYGELVELNNEILWL